MQVLIKETKYELKDSKLVILNKIVLAKNISILLYSC